MDFRIQKIKTKYLVGRSMKMSYTDNFTHLLWSNFMPNRFSIKNRIDNKYYSMQIYSSIFDYSNFNPSYSFIKWAAVEVHNIEDIPVDMNSYELKGGLYAVFTHIGPANKFKNTIDYIFNKWLPNSNYQVDDREHFELLEEGYNPIDENAREEFWIPIKYKK